MDVAELDLRRRESGLYDVLDDVTRGLESVTASGENIMVVADLRGTVLWRSGSHRVLDQAARLGFVEGANWAEDSVGTNAIGTALVSRQAVQIFSAEHYARSHHPWTCAGGHPSAIRGTTVSSASSTSVVPPRPSTPHHTRSGRRRRTPRAITPARQASGQSRSIAFCCRADACS